MVTNAAPVAPSPEVPPRRRFSIAAVLAASLGALAGAAIWAASPHLGGSQEAWDAKNFYYLVALTFGGFGCTLVFPKHLLATLVGMYLGQLGYMLLFLPRGPLMVLGAVFLIGYTAMAVGGGIAAILVRSYVRPAGSG